MKKKTVLMAFVSVLFLSAMHGIFITPVAADPQDGWPFDYPREWENLTYIDNEPQNWDCDWDFNNFRDLWDYISADNDSVELVIGLNTTQQESYVKLMDLITENGGGLVNTISMGGEVGAVVADMPFEALSSFIEKADTIGLSRYIEPNMKVQATLVPNDPYWFKQWGPRKIEADYAWNTTTGNRSILVAVIDSGIDYNHPDLANNYVPLGYNWVNNSANPLDDYGHGTHVAGIIAAELNNGIGIAGLAQVRIMAEKALDQSGGGWYDDLARAIIHAVDQGADILSNSWGTYLYTEVIHDAVKYAYNHSVLVLAAAGNEAWMGRLYPATHDEVIAVTATNESDDPAHFTNYGDWVEVAAPGVDIYSTMPTYHVTMNDPPYNKTQNYDNMSGTSMACPHVAGVAALIWSQFPNMTRDWVRTQLLYTADDLGAPGFDYYYGHGRVNASRAVEQAPSDHDLFILDLQTPWCIEPGNTTVINSTILNFGTNDESNITVQLLVNGSIVDNMTIGFLASGALTTVNFSWTPNEEGVYNVTSYVLPVPGETLIRYNARSAFVRVGAKIIRVPRDYLTIQEAVNASIPGDIIWVYAGTYYEHVLIDKPYIKLVGKDPGTIIDGNGTGTVVTIAEENVEISGFTIRNSGPEAFDVGIRVYVS